MTTPNNEPQRNRPPFFDEGRWQLAGQIGRQARTSTFAGRPVETIYLPEPSPTEAKDKKEL